MIPYPRSVARTVVLGLAAVLAAGAPAGAEEDRPGPAGKARPAPPLETAAALPGDAVDLKAGFTAAAMAVNAGGTIVGLGTNKSGSKRYGWRSINGGSFAKLPRFGSTSVSALGVSPSGTAVGEVFLGGGGRRAFRGGQLLETLGGNDGFAIGINAAGIAVGASSDANNRVSAVRWGADGKVKDLTEGASFARARAINSSGKIVGQLGVEPFLWVEGENGDEGGATRLPGLGGVGVFGIGEAKDINDQDVIVGFAHLPGGAYHAVMWENGIPRDLDPGGSQNSIALAVNSHRQVVGVRDGGAFIWDQINGMRELNCLLPAGSTWSLGTAWDINDAGLIVGQGSNHRGNRRAFLLRLGSVPADRCGVNQLSTVTGRVEFEKVDVDVNGLRLDLPLSVLPAAGVAVELVDATTLETLGTGTTTADGRYAVTVLINRPRTVATLAHSTSAVGRVSRIGSDTPYCIESAPLSLQPGQVRTLEVFASDTNRGSGPFNILDAMRRAVKFIHSANETVVVPPVTVRWAPSYAGGTFYVMGGDAFINGDRSKDSDEFDDAVINHEYGHFIARVLSRDDTPAGQHPFGNRLDPRLAWSEGWANFFGVASLGLDPPSSLYHDSRGPSGSSWFGFDLEANQHTTDDPGHWSEHSVGSALWDLTDDLPDSGDAVADFPTVWSVFAGGLRDERWVYLIDFAEALERVDPGLAANLVAILQERSIAWTPGGTPPVANPYPAPISSGTPVGGSLDSLTKQLTGLMESRAAYEFTLSSPATVRIDLAITASPTPSTSDLDLYLLDLDGNRIAKSDATNGVGGTERIEQSLQPGTYVVEVRSFHELDAGTVFNKADYLLTVNY